MIRTLVLASLVWLAAYDLPVFAQKTEDPGNSTLPATQPAAWPGAGVMVAGELWDSFLPPNAGPYYSEVGLPLTGTFLRIGNFDREWSTPTHMWPGGWPYGMFWAKGMYLAEFNPDTGWNPPLLAGSPNPARHPAAGPNYALGCFASTIIGANDPARNYTRETRWVDPTKRLHAVYEAGWPTNIGIDVKVRIHQFTLNWNNFNDFIIVEIALSNTGVLDLNADGIADSLQGGRPGPNRIRALTMMVHGEIFGMYYLNRAGARSSRLGSARGFGYVGDADRAGSPWNMMVAFAGESVPSVRDMGLNSFTERFYTDVWSAWTWIAARSGSSGAEGPTNLPEKETIYGSPSIGVGSERGWYTSAGSGYRMGIGAGGYRANPRLVHTAAMGTWYADGGRSCDSSSLDLSPNPNFFLGGTRNDPTSFVPRTAPLPPDGDRKLLQERDVNPYEPSWIKGFTAANNFDGDMFSGIGPFSLEAGETMSVAWAEAGGYRLDGVKNAIAAARWAFEHGYTVPDPPPTPEIRVENTVNRSVRIRWDNRAEAHPDFSGYKIYRAAASSSVDWLQGGMRSLDEYWRSTAPGSVPDSLLKPVNPSFAAYSVAGDKKGPPDSWGPYRLLAILPKSLLGSYSDRSASGWTYSWEDAKVDPGFTYWYTVAAYALGAYDLGPSYAGSNDRLNETMESSNLNRNGAEGLWQGAYPFADMSALFPTTPEGKRKLGAGFLFTSGVASPGDLSSESTHVGVRPNPYKRMAVLDSRTSRNDHRVMFFNLPLSATITILDVSGQIINRLFFESPDGESGSMMWDLLSRDGSDLASGLYVYVVEFAGGQQVGYFSILR
jgi:hypothetical protein